MGGLIWKFRTMKNELPKVAAPMDLMILLLSKYWIHNGF